jgi:hypothetical protein
MKLDENPDGLADLHCGKGEKSAMPFSMKDQQRSA